MVGRSIEQNLALLLLEGVNHIFRLAFPSAPDADACAADLPLEVAVLVELEDVRLALKLCLRQVCMQFVDPDDVRCSVSQVGRVVEEDADVGQSNGAVLPGGFGTEERAGDESLAGLLEGAADPAIVALERFLFAESGQRVEVEWTFVVQQNFLTEFDFDLVVHFNDVPQQKAHVDALDDHVAHLHPRGCLSIQLKGSGLGSVLAKRNVRNRCHADCLMNLVAVDLEQRNHDSVHDQEYDGFGDTSD